MNTATSLPAAPEVKHEQRSDVEVIAEKVEQYLATKDHYLRNLRSAPAVKKDALLQLQTTEEELKSLTYAILHSRKRRFAAGVPGLKKSFLRPA